MVAPSRLLSLPVELLAHIILLLHETPRDILACKSTCHKLRDIVCGSVILQYVLRTRCAGVVDPLLPGMSTHERVRALLRWEMPWLFPDLLQPAYLMPQPWADVPVPPWLVTGPETPKYFIQRGRLVSVMSHSPFEYAVLDLRVPPSSLSNSWSLVTIPAFHDDQEYQDERFFQGYEFSFDSDLLVLTHLLGARNLQEVSGGEVEMKLFSISQGKPHPSAPIHTFNIPAEAIHSEYVGVATAVVHDCILVNIASDPRPGTQSHAVAWQGGLVSEGMLYEDNNSSPCFEPLEGDMMLFFRMGWNAIEIGAIRQLGNLEPDVPDVQSFLLPTVNAHIDFMTSAMEAWTWTLPDWEEFAADPAHAPGRLPFHALPENRLITFDTTYGELHRLTFVIPCKNLSALVKRYLPLEPDDAYDHIPWQEWGPQRVHIVRTDSITYGKAVGQRWFFADEQGIGFRDFNPSRVSHAATHFGRAPRVQKNGCTIKVVWGPVVVMPQGGALKEDVVSSLPYVETRLPIPPEDHRSTVGIAVDDERLVHVFDKKIEGGRVQRWMNIYLLA